MRLTLRLLVTSILICYQNLYSKYHYRLGDGSGEKKSLHLQNSNRALNSWENVQHPLEYDSNVKLLRKCKCLVRRKRKVHKWICILVLHSFIWENLISTNNILNPNDIVAEKSHAVKMKQKYYAKIILTQNLSLYLSWSSGCGKVSVDFDNFQKHSKYSIFFCNSFFFQHKT